jgi:cobalamin synthase
MEQKRSEIRKIRIAANIGLYGSLLLCIATVAEHYLAKYVWAREITTNEYTRRLFLVVGLVVAVVNIAMILFLMRKKTPYLRQMDLVDEKLDGYRRLIGTIYYTSLVVVSLVSAIIVITHENTMIMLLLLLFITIVLNYPNMYKMKVDCGFSDQEMKDLFGDNYISDDREGVENAE